MFRNWIAKNQKSTKDPNRKRVLIKNKQLGVSLIVITENESTHDATRYAKFLRNLLNSVDLKSNPRE